ncbi:MAG: DUF1330 domain-containing protein [Rhodospirillaceae bacterium]
MSINMALLLIPFVFALTGPARAEPKNLASSCDTPVIMLVFGQIENQEPMRSYGARLRELNTYPEQQGYYQFTQPTEVFEGEWPGNQFVIGARFPCVEAARGFWYSDDYQSIRHLRSGAGKITITIHPIAEPPAHITGAKPRRLFDRQITQTNP